MKRKAEDSHGAKPVPFWAMGLLKTMKDPKYILNSDNQITIIKDMYPKARHHFLVLPNTDIGSLKTLTKDHVPLLQHMIKFGQNYVEEHHQSVAFKFGYHAEASMFRLHLHIISEDMDSLALKTKKHWNSFTTEFFLNPQQIITDLRENGQVQLPTKEKCKEYMDMPLKCHKCELKPKNMPELKRHLLTHLV
ncbi:unnamed protein product [Ceutorhynchus assimilis]|uniref:HIT domain-containing protein n=1 Tax=Ceutorhynchus assimilis TaxID=467358 RepID=A0A9N9MCZ2_9CUCU|nr:unnamed protein product [Ceutorhynchus assimilis]